MKHLVDHLNHLLSAGNIHQQSSKQGKMMMWFWAQQVFGSRHNYFTKMKKVFHCQRSEPMGSWIPLRELKSDSCHRQFLAHCFQWKVVCWFRGVTPKPPYKSSREVLAKSPCTFQMGNSVLCCILKVWDTGSLAGLLHQDFLQEVCCPWSQLAQYCLTKCWRTSRDLWCRT